MIWDTTQYFLEYDDFFKKIYVNKINISRKNFFLLIQKISNKNKNKNIDWWVSPVGEKIIIPQIFFIIYALLRLYIIYTKEIISLNILF